MKENGTSTSFRGLNLGAGPDWSSPGWEVIDYKGFWSLKAPSAWNIGFPDGHFDAIYTCHMMEHIPHFRADQVIKECHRVLKPGGRLRILCPNLGTIARAYARGDSSFFEKAVNEDPTIRKDLGLGGMLMNFIVSPGSDSLLFSRTGEVIGGYAHVYSWDFDMMKTLLERHGFGSVEERGFLDSSIPGLSEPLHPADKPATWVEHRHWGYCPRGTTGFDRNPLTSLIVEAVKEQADIAPAMPTFGRSQLRGLDAVHLSWRAASRAYLQFTLMKIFNLPGTLKLSAKRIIRTWAPGTYSAIRDRVKSPSGSNPS